MIKQWNSSPRCSGCGRPYQPRQMRDGNWSQTCGQTACVALHNRKKGDASSSYNNNGNNGNNYNSNRRSGRNQPQGAW